MSSRWAGQGLIFKKSRGSNDKIIIVEALIKKTALCIDTLSDILSFELNSNENVYIHIIYWDIKLKKNVPVLLDLFRIYLHMKGALISF